ncbi:hypothetical protein [Shinella sp. JR1-6]|uniref:hypothetical protein n=1 Tax=Shinella sp. JR1-6 TaxID=2527671 RepID=UPI00102D4D87|nr:hypothetical protein [Shinella sp. JR1-6]TAA49609.1 hypothetical protein EXZ48_34100 [Shinella sp. JR1-6]
MRRTYYTVEEHIRAFPHSRRSSLKRIEALEKTNAALRNKPRLKPQHKLNAFLKKIWEFLK